MPEEPWLKICHRLPEDPAVIGIAERTGLDQATVVGQLVRVWIWADQNLVDGNAPSVTEKWLDRYTGCMGFARAMEAERWLVIEAGAIAFPDFERHMGSSAKKRATATVRVQRHRAQVCNAASVTQALPEERREDKNIAPPTPPRGDEVELSESSELETALAEALGAPATDPEKRRRRKTVTQLQTLEATPADVATRVACHRRNWPGLTVTDASLLRHWTACGRGPEPRPGDL